jgi:hypothetical protein
LAVGIDDVAIPDVFVIAVAVLLLPNIALAPVAGAVNVTVTPESGFDAPSVTFACSALANDVFTVVLCGVPDTTDIDCVGEEVDGTKTTSAQ